jgi:hypothetical protein
MGRGWWAEWDRPKPLLPRAILVPHGWYKSNWPRRVRNGQEVADLHANNHRRAREMPQLEGEEVVSP